MIFYLGKIFKAISQNAVQTLAPGAALAPQLRPCWGGCGGCFGIEQLAPSEATGLRFFIAVRVFVVFPKSGGWYCPGASLFCLVIE